MDGDLVLLLATASILLPGCRAVLTFAPCSASAKAIAAPMPLAFEEPVTTSIWISIGSRGNEAGLYSLAVLPASCF